MILTKLFQSVEIPILARNLVVDCCDNQGNHFHKPMQTIMLPERMEDDTEIVTRIRAELRRHDFTVRGISEALGEFEMDGLENIFNGSDYSKHPMRVLYIDVEMAVKEDHSFQQGGQHRAALQSEVPFYLFHSLEILGWRGTEAGGILGLVSKQQMQQVPQMNGSC